MISAAFKCALLFGVGVYLIGSRLLKLNTYLGAVIVKETDPTLFKVGVYLFGIVWIGLGVFCLFKT